MALLSKPNESDTNVVLLVIMLIIFPGLIYFLLVIVETGASITIDKDKLNASLVGTLVLLTAYYVVATFGILKESRKDRKADYIQNQLEKFYTPLITNEQFWQSDYKRFHDARINISVTNERDKMIKVFLDVFRGNKHYASSELDDSINKLENFIEHGENPDTVDIMKKEEYFHSFREFKDEFKRLLDEDYTRLQNELKTLF